MKPANFGWDDQLNVTHQSIPQYIIDYTTDIVTDFRPLPENAR